MIFSQIKTLDQFKRELSTIDDHHDLNEVRDLVKTFNRSSTPHHLRLPEKGFKQVFDALDERAEELGFIKYSFGYRKPITANK